MKTKKEIMEQIEKEAKKLKTANHVTYGGYWGAINTLVWAIDAIIIHTREGWFVARKNGLRMSKDYSDE